MKKVLIVLVISLFFGPLMGCQNYDAAATVQPREAQVQNYRGVIPCADCGGIQVTLSLEQGGRYRLQERYLTDEHVENQQQGHWSRTAEKLVLVSDRGEKRYFRPRDSGLEMTDASGEALSTTLNYRLAPVETGS
ncbi:copper resistance protein NlpE N-terminal domain-containing protein [Erwinia sp. ACCC 02193]|uniref:Copper resistance protein NlpE N-terminal domain-containing protein n=1 Tax=Erwinia aeris TaxID=3239803 RepID=A0ABV4E6L0_9GAMM